MIQDNDTKILGRTNYIAVTRKILEQKGFIEELSESTPNFSKITFHNYDIDLYIVESYIGMNEKYKYVYTAFIEIPIMTEDLHSSTHFESRSFTIYNIGQLEAVMKYKEQLNYLNLMIGRKIAAMDTKFNQLNDKYKL